VSLLPSTFKSTKLTAYLDFGFNTTSAELLASDSTWYETKQYNSPIVFPAFLLRPHIRTARQRWSDHLFMKSSRATLPRSLGHKQDFHETSVTVHSLFTIYAGRGNACPMQRLIDEICSLPHFPESNRPPAIMQLT